MDKYPNTPLLEVPVSRRGLLGAAAAAGTALLLSACGPRTGEWPPAPDPTPSFVQPDIEAPASQSPTPLHTEMTVSSDNGLRQLARQERDFNHRFESAMIFTGIPHNPEEAEAQARDMATTLYEFARYGVQPLVVMTPEYSNGVTADLSVLNANPDTTSRTFDAYFRQLNWEGVTSEQMGRWALFPVLESTSGSSVLQPAVFRSAFTRAAQALKTHFKQAHVSAMFEVNPVNPRAEEPIQYVNGVPRGLIDSIGMQGLPRYVSETPSALLRPNLAMAAASAAGVREIWFNTASFSRAMVGVRETADANLRSAFLGDALRQAIMLGANGYRARLNIVTCDQSPQGGADYRYSSAADAAQFRRFLVECDRAGVPVSVA